MTILTEGALYKHTPNNNPPIADLTKKWNVGSSSNYLGLLTNDAL
jgi:hypothetical protein